MYERRAAAVALLRMRRYAGVVALEAAIQMPIERRSAATLIGELHEERAYWKRRAEVAEARVAELEPENNQLHAQVEAQAKKIADLQQELARAEREGKKSAGRFARRKRKQPRKSPGRKKGQGPFRHREQPPASPDTTHVDVSVPTTCDCGSSRLEFVKYDEASNTELPREFRPQVTRFRVPVCRCLECGATVRGRHPDLAPDQYGASAHRYGDRLMAATHILHYGMGIVQRQVPTVVAMFTGVKVTQSALNQDATRRTEQELSAEYKRLRASMKTKPVGQTDATGWRVDGQPAQMAVFTNDEATVYDIGEHYRNDEIREVYPADYKGTLVGDGAKAFDAHELDDVNQQKCIAHGLRMIGKVHEKQEGKDREFGETLKGLFLEGLALWHGYHDGQRKGYRAKVADLDARLTAHLQDRTVDNDDNQRLLKFFGEHHRKGNLTRFLYDPRVPPTNNLSELELRFLIPARKVSQCSKNDRGANAQKVLASLLRTEKRKMAKENRPNDKPYVGQTRERVEAHERPTRDIPSTAPADSPVNRSQEALPTPPATLLDRITTLFRQAKQRWRLAKEAVDRVFGSPRARSP